MKVRISDVYEGFRAVTDGGTGTDGTKGLVVSWDASDDGSFDPNHGGFFLRTTFVHKPEGRCPSVETVQQAIARDVALLLEARALQQEEEKKKQRLVDLFVGKTFDL
jgi:hypothetical protein